MEAEEQWKTGKTGGNSSCEWHRVDVGGQGPTANKFERGQVELSLASTVWTTSELLKPSRLDELIQGLLNW